MSVLQYNIILQVIATKSINIIIQELMMGISFLPGRISSLTLLVLKSSILTNYVSVHVCTGAGRSTCGGTMKFIIIASFTSPNSGRYYVTCITKSSKKRTRDK